MQHGPQYVEQARLGIHLEVQIPALQQSLVIAACLLPGQRSITLGFSLS